VAVCVRVGSDVWVRVGRGVLLGRRVALAVTVAVAVDVDVGIAVFVAVADGVVVPVAVADGVKVAVAVAVGVRVAVSVAVTVYVAVAVAVRVTVTLGVLDGVWVGARVGVARGTPIGRLHANEANSSIAKGSRLITFGEVFIRLFSLLWMERIATPYCIKGLLYGTPCQPDVYPTRRLLHRNQPAPHANHPTVTCYTTAQSDSPAARPRMTDQPAALNYKFRPVQPADASLLHQTCMTHESLIYVQGLLHNCQRNVLNRRGLGLVVIMDAQIIGFAQLTLWSRAAEISDVVIAPAWRSRGIGTALITRLIDTAREMAHDTVEIGVALSNPHALRLYRRLGFTDGRTLTLDLGSGPEPVLYLEMALKPPPTPASG
jgi:ribosomal protein S18 acetylase RimI-like enzyme